MSNLSNMFFHNTHDSIYDNLNKEINEITSSFDNLNRNLILVFFLFKFLYK